MPVIAFDVDGTLYVEEVRDGNRHEIPRWDVIEMLKTFKNFGWTIIVWSGGGEDYAARYGRLFFITDYVDKFMLKPREPKQYSVVDIAVDDEVVTFGKVNIQV